MRDVLLASMSVLASVDAAKAAGVALGRLKDVDSKLTVDAIVMATAALLDAVVLTGDRADLGRLATHFPGVVVLSV